MRHKLHPISEMMPGEIYRTPLHHATREAGARSMSATVHGTAATLRREGFQGIRYSTRAHVLGSPPVSFVVVTCTGNPDDHTAAAADPRMVHLERLIRGRAAVRTWPAEKIAAIFANRTPPGPIFYGDPFHAWFRWPCGTIAVTNHPDVPLDGSSDPYLFWEPGTENYIGATGIADIQEMTGNEAVWPFEPEQQSSWLIEGHLI